MEKQNKQKIETQNKKEQQVSKPIVTTRARVITKIGEVNLIKKINGDI